MAGETRRIAEFISTTRYQDLPPDVVHYTKRCILDLLGIAVYGAKSDPATKVVNTVKQLGGERESTIIGESDLYPCLYAPMANGTMAYSQMIDDIYVGRFHAHPGNVVVPAALALGESRGISGADFINSVAVGYELVCRAADVVGFSHSDMGFYIGSTSPHFGSAASSAKILGLDTEKCCHTLGLAGLMVSGIWEDGVIQSLAQPFHAGKAANAGIMAALLASNGLAAGDTIFEGQRADRSYASTYSQDPDLDALVDGLGTTFRLKQTGFKFHSSAGGIAPAINAMVTLAQKHGLVAQNVEKITVKGNRLETNHYNPRPKTKTAAVQSSNYCLARALIHGRVLPSHMEPEMLDEPQVVELAGKLNIELDPERDNDLMTPPYHTSATVVVQTKDGKVYEETVGVARGLPDNPATDEDLENKFYDLVTTVVPRSKAEALTNTIWNLDKVSKIGELTALLRP